jgi:hypothetical protein
MAKSLLPPLSDALRERMTQVSDWEQRDTKNRGRQIEVMTDAMLVAPAHPSKYSKRFGCVSQSDHQQTSGADEL